LAYKGRVVPPSTFFGLSSLYSRRHPSITARTWESLVLGNIVIVKRSSLDPLYEGLPVVIIDDWREITLPNLQGWMDQHAAAFGRPDVIERLTNRYWIDRARALLAVELGAS